MAIPFASQVAPYAQVQPRDYSWLGNLAGDFAQGLEFGQDQRHRRDAEGLNRQAIDMMAGGPLGNLGGQPGFQGQQPTRDIPSPFNTPSGGTYRQAVAHSESSNNPSAVNPVSGATGTYQFMPDTWSGLMRNNPGLGLTPDGMTDPRQQETAMTALTQENAGALQSAGLPQDAGSLYAMHFLGASEGPRVLSAPDETPVARLVRPATVRQNPHLRNMTVGQFKQWATQQGGGGGRAAPQQVAQAGGGMATGGAPSPVQGMSEEQRDIFARMLSNPYTERLGMALLQRRMDPGEMGFKVVGDTLVRHNPDGSATPVFQAPQRDDPTSLMQNLESAGFQPGTPEYRDAILRGIGGTTVNVGQSEHGTIPPGYQLRRGEDGGLSMEPIPGGPVALEQEEAGQSAETKDEQQRTWNSIVGQEIDRALNIIGGDSMLPVTGFGSELASGVGGTDARNLRGLLDTIRANAGFDRLQAMRDSSPTGGALGQVSERELAFLQSTIGNLEQSQSQEQLSFNLRRLKRLYQNMLEGRRAYDGLLEESGQGAEGVPQGAPQAGTVEDGYRFKGGNPADPNSWERVN